MPYLQVGATVVNVVTRGPLRAEVPVGEVRRAFSGLPRSSVSAYEHEWTGLETSWLTVAQANTLRALLKGTPPVAVTGDLTGSISVFFTNIREVEKGEILVAGVRTEHVRLGFDIWPS